MPREARLRGRTALVSGGSTGIGEAICRELAAQGAAVAVDYVGDPAPANRLVEELRGAGAKAVAVAIDVAQEEQVVKGVAEVEAALGPVDLLVNNAGIESFHRLVEMDLESWQRVLAVNLTGPFLLSREVARRLLALNRPGIIVNISSVHERIPWEGYAHYCASKGGLKLFSETIAKELAPCGIRVLCVAPGAIETPINREVLADPEQSAAVQAEIPLGRWGKPQEVAKVVAWLASEEADYITGTTVFVDGGMTLYPRFV